MSEDKAKSETGNTILDQTAEFFSKTEFDFSTPAGWEEFLKERSSISGTGVTADGYHLRDFDLFSVYTSNYYAKGPVDVIIYEMVLPGALTTPPGILYVYYPGPDWKMTVKEFYAGLARDINPVQHRFVLGGPVPNPDFSPYWGAFYFLAIAGGMPKIPAGVGKAVKAIGTAGKVVSRAAAPIKRGLSVLGAGYRFMTNVGGKITGVNDVLLQQRIFAPKVSSPEASTKKESK